MRAKQDPARSRGSSPIPTSDNPAACEREDIVVGQDDRMRQCFRTALGKELGICSHYTHVAVLIVHWARELNTDLKFETEVQTFADGCFFHCSDFNRRTI